MNLVANGVVMFVNDTATVLADELVTETNVTGSQFNHRLGSMLVNTVPLWVNV